MAPLSLAAARWLAPASLAANVAAQTYGILSTPSMKDVHDANLAFFSPQPALVAAFFLPQQLVSLAWLRLLWKAKTPGGGDNEAQDRDTATMLAYAPFFIFGNLCIAIWMPFWNASLLTPAALLVAANALAQLTFVFARLGPLTCASAPGAAAVLTHAAAKAAAGLGVLDVLHNGSVALLAGGGQGGAAPVPGLAVEVATGVVFAVLACASDWLLGACLVFDLVALAVGQSGYGNAGWAAWLAVYAGGVAVVVAARSGVWKLYARTRRDGYQTLD